MTPESEVFNDYGRFAQIPVQLLDAQGVSNNAKVLYAILWSFTDGSSRARSAYPSRKRLSDRLGASLATVDRCIRELVTVGAIAVTSRRTKDGDRSSNLYRILVMAPVVTSDDTPPHPRGEGLVTSDEGVASGEIEDQEPFTQEPFDLEPPNKTLASIEATPDWFEIVWAEWPKKDDKKDARARWPKAVQESQLPPSVLAMKAIEHARAYKAYRTRQMTPAFVVWLNKARWDNEPVGPYEDPATKQTRTQENVSYVTSLYEQQQMEIEQ